MEAEEIASQGPGEYNLHVYTLPSGKFIRVGEKDCNFFESLQKLPTKTKIQMMKINIDDIYEYINIYQDEIRTKAINYLCDFWEWRDTGEQIQDDEQCMLMNDLVGFNESFLQIARSIKRNKLKYNFPSYLLKIKDFFEKSDIRSLSHKIN